MSSTTKPFFDPNFFKSVRMPSLDMQAVYATQRKNMEAFANAGTMAFEGAQELTKKQAEIFHKSFDELSEAGSEVSKCSSIEDVSVKNAQILKTVYQATLSNIWDLSDLTSKSSTRSLGVINKRVAEAFDEVKSYFKATPTKTAS